jgi:hypothetical protein
MSVKRFGDFYKPVNENFSEIEELKNKEKNDLTLKNHIDKRVSNLIKKLGEETESGYTLGEFKDALSTILWDDFGLDFYSIFNNDSNDDDIKESHTDTVAEILDIENIQPGDFVNFGEMGNLYVIREEGDGFIVTDVETDRFNPEAEGGFIEKKYVRNIINKGDDYEQREVDSELLESREDIAAQMEISPDTFEDSADLGEIADRLSDDQESYNVKLDEAKLVFYTEYLEIKKDFVSSFINQKTIEFGEEYEPDPVKVITKDFADFYEENYPYEFDKSDMFIYENIVKEFLDNPRTNESIKKFEIK